MEALEDAQEVRYFFLMKEIEIVIVTGFERSNEITAEYKMRKLKLRIWKYQHLGYRSTVDQGDC